ncbi:hypothetical protein SY91_06991 (plasmid) [Burkholderia cenocepacia]|jgi:type IV secretory pathway VirB2 component (pilin)|nr:hypothetical protein SY91_06991 [Burkholderia cenocepacia]
MLELVCLLISLVLICVGFVTGNMHFVLAVVTVVWLGVMLVGAWHICTAVAPLVSQFFKYWKRR